MEFEMCIPRLEKSWNLEELVGVMEKLWNFRFLPVLFWLKIETISAELSNNKCKNKNLPIWKKYSTHFEYKEVTVSIL